MEALKNKPWNAPDAGIPTSIFQPKGMLGEEERRCLYWLARNVFSNRGAIVDAGSYIGASAFCFSKGLIDAGHTDRSKPVIHSYDTFVALDDYVAESISRDVRPIKRGESFLDIFVAQNAGHQYLIETHPGDFLQQRWNEGPIEILFIDLAKTQELNSHVVSQFFPHLIPERSTVIQQDFYHVWHPAIHVTMQYLKKYFEIIDPYVPYQSRMYRLSQPILAEDLTRVINYDFSFRERLALIDDAAAESPSPICEMLHAVAMYESVIQESLDDYRLRKAMFEQLYPNFRSEFALWAVQAQAVEAYARQKFGKKADEVFKTSSASSGTSNRSDMNASVGTTQPSRGSTLMLVTSEDRAKVLDEIILNYPSFHRQADGSPWYLGISGQNLKFMASLLQPGMRTIETGAGMSSLAFIIMGCRHTAICPSGNYENHGLERRIREFCEERGLDHSSFELINARSQDVVPRLDDEFDFVFIDGDHGFPLPIIDFYYLARRLRVGGVLAIDDTTIWTGEVVAKYLMLDKDWQFISEQDTKTSYFRLLASFADKGFSRQTYVLANSRCVSPDFLDDIKR